MTGPCQSCFAEGCGARKDKTENEWECPLVLRCAPPRRCDLRNMTRTVAIVAIIDWLVRIRDSGNLEQLQGRELVLVTGSISKVSRLTPAQKKTAGWPLLSSA